MKASRKRPKGAFRRLFGLVICSAVLMPSGIGYQDLAALIARQPAVTERWRQHVRNSAFGTIHAATFSFPRPMGAAIPDPYFTQLASLDPRALEVTGSVPLHAPIEPVFAAPRLDFPTVERRLKGDRLTTEPPPAESAPAPEPEPSPVAESEPASVAESEQAPKVAQQPEIAAPPVSPPADIAERSNVEPVITDERPDRDAGSIVETLAQLNSPETQTARLFFGAHAIGFGQHALEPWEPDEVPTVLAAPHVDPEIKRAAIDASAPDPSAETAGETIAPKGEVTGEGRRPRTPAERLNLSGASRVKHERCLANAIYFEARGEVERGQMAVAQVVLNRAFSGYYPGNVCDVVYQNAHRHLACQFTFACDNVRDVVNDPKAWAVATRIAREALDGKFWLPEIGKATHYHATYVNPWWVRTMKKHSRLGVHIFYRPKRWGDGDDIPVWGDRLDVTVSTKSSAEGKPAESGTDTAAAKL